MFARCLTLGFNGHMSAAKTFLNTLRLHALVPSGSHLVVAVSGGADSLALLHLLYTHRHFLKCVLHVATLDHGLRGEAGASDAQFVTALAQTWELDVTAGYVDVMALAEEQGIGIEAAARLARYDFLAQVAANVGAKRVAVAHQSDDQAETVLMHLLRGAGIVGIEGMGYSDPLPGDADVLLIRPLLELTRKEIEAYCREHALHPRHDVTNEDINYTRNRLRHEILPYLEALYPHVKRALIQLADVAAVESDFAQRQFKERLVSHTRQTGERFLLQREVFKREHPALQRRFIRWAAEQMGEMDDLGYAHITAAVELMVRGGQGAVALLPNGVQLRVDYDTIVVERTSAPPMLPEDGFLIMGDHEIQVQVPGDTVLSDNWLLCVRPLSFDEAAHNQECLSLTIKPSDKVLLRTRRQGDRFDIVTGGGERHTHKVSHWMIDSKIPQAVRQHVPLLVINGKIAAILWGKEWKVASSYARSRHSTGVFCLWLVNRNR